MAMLQFLTGEKSLRKDRGAADDGRDFLALLERAYREADYEPATSESAASRSHARAEGAANNAIEGLSSRPYDAAIHEVIDRHAVPSDVAVEILGRVMAEHPKAFERFTAAYE